MPINIYVPKLERHASSIVHNGVPVWTADEGERCISAASYLKGEEPYLMHISKNNASNEKSMQFYARDAGKWTDIDHREFNMRQDALIKTIAGAIK
ncbi:hypothetical protein BEWA_015930 [Theileria equi strain WA]|uniref:Uncharacterized protein n=1 Tax=Theileria equi strain WA TaxID=1537102 RepID=L1LC55_THEEQ|nr:hypothetical protein BEWA_015930 [Theileria equi strain WA]EKX73032.1 hypothetical protein BEWA_015930 [Theileria equi strain WA]|eukprot:XP_004832484.1 hypothetical protein BEWA_015930 [Theileria equi strain WA]